MNQNLIIGILAAVVIIGGGYFLITANNAPDSGIATSTPTVADTTADNTTQNPGNPSTASAPTTVTNSSVAPTDTTAVVTGTVRANGALTSYWYEYGNTANLGSNTAKQNIGYAYYAIPAPGYITGLTKDATYYFRLAAENQYGRVSGKTYSFRTTINIPPPVGSAPDAKTLAGTGITRTSANLSGEVTPNQATTQYWFEYGTTANLGSATPLVSVGNGSAKMSASASLSNLDPNTKYYFRMNAQNQFGTVNGNTLTFTTSGPSASAEPVVTTQVPGPVATTTATLRGTVNPSNSQTTYWFEYSTDSLLGSVLLKTTQQRSAGAGTNTSSVEANVSSLSGATNYYYRIVARNSAGTVRGDNMTFTTK